MQITSFTNWLRSFWTSTYSMTEECVESSFANYFLFVVEALWVDYLAITSEFALTLRLSTDKHGLQFEPFEV